MEQTATPLLTALAQAVQRGNTAFYAPGHKQGHGILPDFKALLGPHVFRADLPELPELDNLFAPQGPIHHAQQLAAGAFGAEETFFLANGSTCGIEAAVLATCSPGEKILVPRNAHQSVLSGLVLSGASPVFVAPTGSSQWDLAYGVTPEQIRQGLDRFPDLAAVVVISPNYHGVCADLTEISAIVRRHHKILIVDEAHGPHLGFHPQLPPGALSAGADIVIQSTHKVLSALTQASMLHCQGSLVNRDRLRQALQLTQSTSPNYLLLASLDAARCQMATQGQALLGRTLEIVSQVRSRLSTLQPLRWLTSGAVAAASGGFQLDPTRLTIDVSPLGLTGFAADAILHEQLGVTAELPTLRQLALIFSLGNTAADGNRLIKALETLVERANAGAIPNSPPQPDSSFDPAKFPSLSQPPLSPRDTFFARHRTVAIADAVGEISASTLCPYPPGIPVILPGECISAEAVAYLQQIQAAGGVITGGPSPDLSTVRVVQPTKPDTIR